MASPHYNGIDERNGFLPVVDTVTDLQAQAGGYPGRPVYVMSLRKVFTLDPFSTDTANDTSVIAAISGGRWIASAFAPSNDDIMLGAQGILAQNLSRLEQNSTSALISGTAYFMGIPLRAGMVATNISVCVLTAAAATTVSKVGLFTKAGVQLAVSADQGTAWQSTGVKTVAMVAAYTVPTSDMYYAALISVFTSTAPALSRGAASGAVNINLGIGAGSLLYGVQLAQADMPSPATIVQGSTTAINYWAAIS